MRRRAGRELDPETLSITSAAHDGRGIAHVDGKVVFVSGALPGERVEAQRHPRRGGYDEAETISVIEPSPMRVEPKCAHFGVCGGCSLQHAAHPLQLEIKQQALADNLERIGNIVPERWLPPVVGDIWGYRRRARLSCRFVDKKGRQLVGFRERGRPYVADLQRCIVLSAPVDGLIEPLTRLIGALESPRAIPQIEVAIGDDGTILVLRHLEPLTQSDRDALSAFQIEYEVRFYLQSAGPDSIVPLEGSSRQLHYTLHAHDVTIAFEPTDFVQVNADVNNRMVKSAMELLSPHANGRYLDLFCGLGNFTLPLARLAGHVTGVEGDAGLVERARGNAVRNGLENVEFHVADLFQSMAGAAWCAESFDGVLLDPPRAGALAIMPLLGAHKPQRIVYVSCHPGTLARDAGELVSRYGYRLTAAGILDMFPHTAHVESIALFEC